LGAESDLEADSGLLHAYSRLVRASPHNLLSKRGLEELESRHVPESARFALALPTGGEVLDLGSGGGLPGLVIAILRPDVGVHLVEATRKKAEFLRDAADALGLTVTIHHARAEELADGDLRERFPIVTARAVARLSALADLAYPFLAPGGALYAIKGERWRSEVEELSDNRLELASSPDAGPITGTSGPSVVVLRRARR